MQDHLQHYGVIGMKWGKRKLGKLVSSRDRLREERDDLDKRSLKADTKMREQHQSLNKQRDKLNRKLSWTFNSNKIDNISKMIDEIDSKYETYERPVKAIKSQIESNDRMQTVLNKTISAYTKEYVDSYNSELTRLKSINTSKSKSKIERMKKERSKFDKKFTIQQ